MTPNINPEKIKYALFIVIHINKYLHKKFQFNVQLLNQMIDVDFI